MPLLRATAQYQELFSPTPKHRRPGRGHDGYPHM
nr:MAG TPA: hypothetical protein [Caudoviricetes sp.]